MKRAYLRGGWRRSQVAWLLALAAALLLAGVAYAATGDLLQKPSPDGCVSDGGGGGECVSGLALDGAEAVAVSPDGRSVYVAARNIGGVAIFDRDPTTGELTQKAGTAGCVTTSGGSCQIGTALSLASGVAVSPDGASVYVAASAVDAVAIFDRNTTDTSARGALTQKTGTAGCISEDGSGGACQNGDGLDNPVDITVSPDGESVYTASNGGHAVAMFDRVTTATPTKGELSQPAGACVSQTGAPTCADGKALEGANGVAVSPNGAGVYVSSFASGAVAIFDRNTISGALAQKAGTAGCISDTGNDGADVAVCQDGTGLNGANGVKVSPDGTSVYTSALFGDSVAVFDRDTTNGTLDQKDGLAACVSEDGVGPCQIQGGGLNGATGVALSPDGASVYASSASTGAVAILDRDTATGALTPRTGTARCISDTGSGGACQLGVALEATRDVAVSPDGTSVYAVAGNDDAVSIFDRDLIQISIDDVAVTEGNSGPAALDFTVSLSTTSLQQITVDFATADGTATEPGDYAAGSGTVTFAPGDTEETVSIDANGDASVEPDETLNVGLSNPTNAEIADAQGVGTIDNDDAVTPPAPPPADDGPADPEVFCAGRVATIVGTDGADALTGTSANDVIAALGGNDVAKGGGGNDLICGGLGKDNLKGGAGKDRLLGEGGKDTLAGGAGKGDICNGGPSKDTAKGSCEKAKSA